MTEQSQYQSLQALLSQQTQLLKDMQALLVLELEAVKTRSGDKIIEIAQQKEALLKKVVETDNTIAKSPNVEALTTEPTLVEAKQIITQLLEECQTQNEVIYLTAKQNEVAIDQVKMLLLGGSKNSTYDAYGQKKSGPTLTKGIKA
ncbi:flagellar export chaperone FlgN [Psychrosphaera ytuae]|uniref:Flagellar export chaperone FlgN n=1 Tax=Psychrosphaera ytuae TaxID=2820710 RepID=A0A975DCJ4_9GAMM|nr:flagellar export chaperone FlgN [Psychrosphaera ytuae]QTH64655.1 flagellar export chaperone FlgN [Psychrosphaera ytuae]